MVVAVILLIVFLFTLRNDPPVRQLLNLAAGNHKPTVLNGT